MRVFLAAGTPNPHPVIKELINYPPVEYVSPRHWGQEQPRLRPGDFYWLAQAVLMRFMTMRGLPKQVLVPNRGVDLIHACHLLVLNCKPWVVEVPDLPNCFGYSRTYGQLRDKRFRRIVENALASERCKRILPYTEAMRYQLEDLLDTARFAHKVEVVNPAYHRLGLPVKTPGERVKLLFIGSPFYTKGGRELLEAFRLLRERYPGQVELDMVCFDIPVSVREQFANARDVRMWPAAAAQQAAPDSKIKSLLQRVGAPTPRPVPRDKVEELYREADIFVYPTMAEGMFVYLEAMAHGLPIVATNVDNSPEFVDDGVTGFLVDCPISWTGPGKLEEWDDIWTFKNIVARREFPELVTQLADRIGILVENPGLRPKMGREAKRRVDVGPFSIEKRNAKLREVYQRALADAN